MKWSTKRRAGQDVPILEKHLDFGGWLLIIFADWRSKAMVPRGRSKLLLIAMTTVSCVEDDSVYCFLLTRALAKNKTIRILSVHSRAEEALKSLPSLRPD